MSFTDSTLIFSLLIFAITLSLTPRKFIAFVSVFFLLVFLFIYSPYSAVVFLISSTLTFYIFSLKKESFLLPGIFSLVVIFILFKIQTFFDMANPLLYWGYPVGLSYFAVRQIHFMFEAYKENITEITYIEFISYAGFFPAFFTGPIHRFPEFINDLKSGSFNLKNLSAGLERILYGYAKIVFVANYLVMDVFQIYCQSVKPFSKPLFQYLECIRYGANLYFQFAGYTDVAIGVALIAGFKLKENFNFPFLAKNINEFWKRWHISLSDWCRDYVFKPAYAQTRIFSISIILTMLAIGIWHEFSSRYVAWALYHGMGIALWQFFDKNKLFRFGDDRKFMKTIATVVSVLITVNFVILSFCITRVDSLERSLKIFTTILGSFFHHVFFFI